jgi:hypothetical protein
MHHLTRSNWSPVLIMLMVTAIAVIACGNGEVQPENMRITTPLQTACGVSAASFAFGESAFTPDTEMLDIRFKVDIIRTAFASEANTLLVVYAVEIENQGDVLFALMPSLQIFVASVGGQSGVWGVSGAAMDEAGLTLDKSILDVTEVAGDETVYLEMAAYTPIGAIDHVTLILDPLAAGTPHHAQWQTINPNNCLEEQ